MAAVMPRQMFNRPGDPSDITLFINGEKHTVSDKYSPTTSLNDYLRNVAGLKGTKVMCNEGGCGCCAVAVTHNNGQDKMETFSINSCLCPLYAADGWQISTVEGIGNSKEGFHPIQEKIAKYNGTQCGYCTPGFVMSMYGLLHQDNKPTQQEIEDSFDGHICRCTGYRPILDAMKTFASDASGPNAKCIDIEDLNKKLCSKTGEPCKGTCHDDRSLKIDLYNSQRWYRPSSLKELASIVKENKNSTSKFVYGNTASGIFKNDGPFQNYIDLHAVKELYQFKKKGTSYVFGASTTLTKLKERLNSIKSEKGFEYCERVVKHLKVLASVLVRNAGCIAGNFMIKHAHPEFPSDLFTLTETIGASVNIQDLIKGKESKHSMEEFLRKVDMTNKVIISLELPAFDNGTKFRSFKITPRSQNAHAYVNAAFKIPMNGDKISKQPSILYGGISKMSHAVKTEAYLNGKKLDYAVIKEALSVLEKEIEPTVDSPLSPSPQYRKNLAINLLYKTLLEISPQSNTKVNSGANSIDRPLSTALHTFQEKPEEFPLKQPMPKLTAPLQASGQAVYTNDIPNFQRELFGAFVLSTCGNGKIQSIDPAPALEMPGVIRFISSKDIPDGGINNFMKCLLFSTVAAEEVFASSRVEFSGQPLGMILAESHKLASEAAKKVKVVYTDLAEVITKVARGAEVKSFHDDGELIIVEKPEETLKSAHKVVEGEVRGGSQYYYFIETQVSVAVPQEDGMDVYTANQFMDQAQTAVSTLLNKPFNYFNMIGNRVGGSFGGKALAASLIAASAALGAYVVNRPVRIQLDMSDNMKMFSSRFPVLAKYKAGVSSEGKMEVIDADLFVDSGFKRTMMSSEFQHHLDQGYFVPNWRINAQLVKTNKPTSMAVRGPGSVPAALVMESIMEHVAKEINMHPIDFKEKNLYEEGQTDMMGRKLENCTLRDMWTRLKQTSEVNARRSAIETFNQANTWKKRAITMTSVKYAISFFPPGQTTHISVFATDGSVHVNTTGIEMGQGLYTKVAQAVAATLKVPIDTIKVRPNQNNVTPNPGVTGGSSGSETCVNSAVVAAEQLNQKLAPLREKMPDADWKGILQAAYFAGIDLIGRAKGDVGIRMPAYNTYCVGAAETEVDVLTGEYQIRRVDLMSDYGESLNPTIDIGQTEGAYVMGLGAYLTEDVIFDTIGTVLNDGTWEYKPPTTKDIPIDWRIHFLPDSPNKVGILSSKAVGEPPIGLSVGSMLAIKAGIEAARKELTGKVDFIPVDTPYTVEKIQMSAGVNAFTASV